MTTKPVLDWSIEVFLQRMKSLGVSVSFIGTPATIPNLRSIDGKALASVADLDQTSKNAIQAFLDEQRADGALVLDTPTWRVDGTTYQSIVMTDLAVYPYKLSKMSGDQE